MSLDWTRIRASVVSVRAGPSRGSGWLAAVDLVVTNVHVIGHADEATVVVDRGEEVPANVVFVDTRLDVALLVPSVSLGRPPLQLAREDPAVGSVVFAIGHPLNLDFSVTRGIVSATRRVMRGVPYIQTDAALNPGNSGGPLVDEDGYAVGMSTWIRVDGQNLGFGVPVSSFLDVIAEHASPADTHGRRAVYRCTSCETAYEVGDDRCLACGDALPYTSRRSVLLASRRYVEAERVVSRMITRMGYVPSRVSDEPGHWRLPQANGEVWVRLDDNGEYVSFFAPLVRVPREGYEAFFRFLLTFNDQSSGACRTALAGDTVMLSYSEPTAFMSEKGVTAELARMLGSSTELRDVLQQSFGAPAIAGEDTRLRV